ncbi:MAG: hypothetical protein KKB77_05060 [Bacteroidetes bacterium]|nr:hypothetical protein [Bacteroidota bacterium]
MRKTRSFSLIGWTSLILIAVLVFMGQEGCDLEKGSNQTNLKKDSGEYSRVSIIIEKKESGGWAPLPAEQITPDFRLYEDGTVIYKKYIEEQDPTKIKFMIEHLTNSQISELLRFIQEQRFFEMQDYYPEYSMDAVFSTLTVRGENGLKTVTVGDVDLGPKSFAKICEKLDRFSIPTAIKYHPKIIILFVSTLPQANLKEFKTWPVASVNLEQAIKLKKIVLEGNDLGQVMKVMENQLIAFFSFRGKVYQVVTKIHLPDE